MREGLSLTRWVKKRWPKHGCTDACTEGITEGITEDITEGCSSGRLLIVCTQRKQTEFAAARRIMAKSLV